MSQFYSRLHSTDDKIDGLESRLTSKEVNELETLVSKLENKVNDFVEMYGDEDEDSDDEDEDDEDTDDQDDDEE